MSSRIYLLHPPPWLHRFVILPLSLLHVTFRDLFQGLFQVELILPSFPTPTIPPVPAIAPAITVPPLPAIAAVAKTVDKGFAHRWRWPIRFAFLFGLRIIHLVLRERLFPDSRHGSSTHRRRRTSRRAKGMPSLVLPREAMGCHDWESVSDLASE